MTDILKRRGRVILVRIFTFEKKKEFHIKKPKILLPRQVSEM